MFTFAIGLPNCPPPDSGDWFDLLPDDRHGPPAARSNCPLPIPDVYSITATNLNTLELDMIVIEGPLVISEGQFTSFGFVIQLMHHKAFFVGPDGTSHDLIRARD
jgi:hypothetical protein